MKCLLLALLCGFSVAADDTSFLWNHKKKLALLAGFASHLVLRATSTEYKESTDKAYDQAKELLLVKVAAPVLTKLERAKREGLAKKDMLLGVAVGTLFGILLNHYQVHTCDTKVMQDIFSKDLEYIDHHRVPVGLGVLAVATAAVGYFEGFNLPHVQQFLASLSRRQKVAIEDNEQMKTLLENLDDDPQAVLEHNPLRELLHDHQKELLDKAVQEQMIHNNPLSVLDDLDDLDDF